MSFLTACCLILFALICLLGAVEKIVRSFGDE